MVAIKVYVEGGGRSNDLRTKCRRGFSSFLEKAGLRGCMPRVVACGSRKDAYDDFCTALRVAGPDNFPVLLVDSEGPVPADSGPWTHLRDRPGDEWDKPVGATDDHVHLMVQCMEAWFLADKDGLRAYYGQGFRSSALPAGMEIELIPKDDILASLERATDQAKTKGRYEKGDHSFEILARIDPDLVQSSCPSAKRLLSTLRRKMEL